MQRFLLIASWDSGGAVIMPGNEFVERATAIARTDAASLSSDNLPITRADAGVAEQITITVLPKRMAIFQLACQEVLQPILTYL